MTTKVEVCGHRVLLRPTGMEDKTDWGFDLAPQGDLHKREKAGTVIGEVVDIGPTAWRAFDGDDPNWKPWCKIGDIVYFAKHAGKFITIDGETYLLVLDADIQAVILEGDAINE